MRQFVESGSRFATVRPELEPLVDGVAFEPKRAGAVDAQAVLDRDGAVILSSYPPTPRSLVVAAAEVLGTRLRHVQPARTKDTEHSDSLARDQPDVPTTSRACRHLEYTRTGRRIVRASWYTQALRRDPRCDEHERMVQRYADVWTTLTAVAPRFLLGAGEILFIDNYRCFHGVDAWNSRRIIHSLTVRSVDAK